MTKQRKVTSFDVANEAGVSQATVSAVISESRSNMRISSETRDHVLAVARKLGYSPNLAARALGRRQSGIIGFVPLSTSMSPLEYPLGTLLGLHIAQAALQFGYHITQVRLDPHTARRAEDLNRFLRHHNPDGIILDRPRTKEEVQSVLDWGLPVVQVIGPQGHVATSTVTVDSAPGIQAAINHLVQEGHRRIAFVGWGTSLPLEKARFDCFRATLGQHGISVPNSYLQLRKEHSINEGCLGMQDLLALPDRPTAVFTTSDALASGVLRALYDARLHVPDDISLVSNDDTLAEFLNPPLTTVALPLREVAEHTISLIHSHIKKTDSDSPQVQHVMVPTSFTTRRSTRFLKDSPYG